MNIKEEAMNFAIKAFGNKVRKAEPEKESVLHSIDVGYKLMKYGFDDNVVAAGYLHDVVEDTDYTIEDIRNIFGDDIASLVKGATEEDRTLSWEERKQGTITRIKNLDLRHKAVITCDKLSNTEDLLNYFGRIGKEDYTSFTRGKGQKIWYWQEAYKSLIYNEDENIDMFKDLKNNIDLLSLKKEINNEPLSTLKYKKEELTKLASMMNLHDLYRIEIISNNPNIKTIIENKIRSYLNTNKIYTNTSYINIIDNLINIDINYLKENLPSDIYIERLDNYCNYIKDNINKIIYIISKDNKDINYQKSFKRIINLLNNNNIDIEVIDINNKNIDNDIIDICNDILNKIRGRYLSNIKKKLRKRRDKW